MDNLMKILAPYIGWVGAFILVGTYFALTKGRILSNDLLYQQLNLLAAFLLGLSAISYGAWFSVALNLFWVLVSLYGIGKIKRR